MKKIGLWEADNWVWGEDPNWDRDAAAVAEGALDKVKQDSLYVRIGINGQVTRTPVPISKDALAIERERAERMASLVESILNAEKHPGLDWDKIEGAFRILFSEVRETTRRS